MKLARPRITVRRLMVLSAVVAMVLAVEIGRRRSAYFRSLAEQHFQQEKFEKFMLDGGTAVLRGADGKVIEVNGPSALRWESSGGRVIESSIDPSPGYDGESLRRRVEYQGSLRRKYERAARFPWLSVEPDPPSP